MTKTIEREGYAELYNGRIYWVKIELQEQKDGVLFISPVDKEARLVEGITIADLEGEWRLSDYLDEILSGIADAGGGRWIMGYSTEYDLIEEDGKYYLDVTEVIRGDIDELIKEREEEENF